MTSENSLKAYYELKEDGTLSARRLEVFEAILENPDKTNGELCLILGGVDSNYVNPRRRELVLMGLIESNGSRVCSYTGKTAKMWKVVNEIDTKKARETSFKQKKQSKLDSLEIMKAINELEENVVPYNGQVCGSYWKKGEYINKEDLKNVLLNML